MFFIIAEAIGMIILGYVAVTALNDVNRRDEVILAELEKHRRDLADLADYTTQTTKTIGLIIKEMRETRK